MQIDELMKIVGAEDKLRAIDESHFRHHGHAKPHGHRGTG
jgi:hypothetical protein